MYLSELYQVYATLGVGSYLVIFTLGLILGSFLNSWIWRTRENIKVLTFNRSICCSCRRNLSWYENIPVISYIFLGGRCRVCRQPISCQYPLVELGTALVLTFIAWYHVQFLSVFSFSLWLRDVFFVTILIVVFVYDFLYQEVLLRVAWAGIIVGFIINYYFLNYSLSSLVWGLLIGGGFFAAQYFVSKGRWVGGGDVRLGMMIGVWLGWPRTIVALTIAYGLGALVAVFLLISKKATRKTALPFGTFLSLGTFGALYFGNYLLNWYLNLIK